MYFDRFDVAAAWNLFLQDYHGGQWSVGYRRLRQLQNNYKPSRSEETFKGLSDNAKQIYRRLVRLWKRNPKNVKV